MIGRKRKLDRYISDQCASSNRSNSCAGLLFFSFFFSLVFRLSSDFILVASLPSGAASVFGLGSGATTSCDFVVAAGGDFAVGAAAAAASSSSTSLRACASASLRRVSSSAVISALARDFFSLVLTLESFLTFGTSVVVALMSAAGLVLLTGLDNASGVDAAVGSFGLMSDRASSVAVMLSGFLTGPIISHAGSVGLEGSDEEDIGRSMAICEFPHSSPTCLGEYAGVEGAESMKVPKDLADIGGDIGPGDRGVIGDDSAGESGRMIVVNL